MTSPFSTSLRKQLLTLEKQQLYRRRRVIATPQGRELQIDGRRLLNFSSNDYLGLANDPRVCEAFKRGVNRWGSGSGASHLVCGHTVAHEELEQALAAFTGRERALLFPTGYAANTGTLNALLTKGDHVYQDRLNHASLLEGGWLSRAEVHWFEHCDYAALAAQLAATGATAGRQLIASDGTFSMDGGHCDLDVLVSLARAQDAWLMIDDAHSLGVMGSHGCGRVDPLRYDSQDVPVLMGTLSKALGTSGAFVAGDSDLIELLIQKARNYIFSTAMPAAVAVATLESLRIAQAEEWRRDHLRSLITHFRTEIQHLPNSRTPTQESRTPTDPGPKSVTPMNPPTDPGPKSVTPMNPSPDSGTPTPFQLLDSWTPIQPLITGNEESALRISRALESRGFLVTAIRPPTVPKGASRLRICLSAAHTHADVDALLTALSDTAGSAHV
ncbi:MAG: 8-amino-7-oxononanoate synthase [Pseudohongiellaceae bacterium]